MPKSGQTFDLGWYSTIFDHADLLTNIYYNFLLILLQPNSDCIFDLLEKL